MFAWRIFSIGALVSSAFDAWINPHFTMWGI
jgi:hypothetical protein